MAASVGERNPGPVTFVSDRSEKVSTTPSRAFRCRVAAILPPSCHESRLPAPLRV